MNPDDERDARRIDGLLATYGELTKQVAIIEIQERETRAALDKAMLDMGKILERFDRECEKKVARLESSIGELDDKLGDIEKGQRGREETQMKERKSDRRWLVGTVLTAAGLVIAALALLQGAF